MTLKIFSDSSAARAFASRRRLGRQPHVQTRYLWLQERVATSHLTVQKIKTTQNPADILTKAASGETLERHRKKIGLRHVEAHRSQEELRLESFATDPMSELKPIKLCATCGENEQDNFANDNTVDEQEMGAPRCWSGLRWNSTFRRTEEWTSIRTRFKSTRWDELRNC